MDNLTTMPERLDYKTKCADIKWDTIEQDVITRLRLLRAVWEASERDAPPDEHYQMARHLYLPVLSSLTVFLGSIDLHVGARKIP